MPGQPLGESATVDDLFKKLLGIAGYLFGVLLLAFTGMQTYSLLFEVSGSALTAAIGLVLFEGGMIYWWSVFRREAHGLFQMALSLLLFIVSMALVGTAVALHLGAVGATFLGPETPARIIVAAALLNLVAKLIYPLVHPDVFTAITDRANEGKILNRTYERFKTKVDDIAEETADQMAEEWKDRTRRVVLQNWEGSLNKKKGAASAAPATEKVASVNGDGPRPTHRPDGR